MSLIRSIIIALKLSANYLAETLRYFTVGSSFRGMKTLERVWGMTKRRTYMEFKPNNEIQFRYEPAHKVLAYIHTKFPGLIGKYSGYGEKYNDKAIWLVKSGNRKNDDPILVFVHGGAYMSSASDHQIESVLALYKLLDKDFQSRFSILFLEYSLASHGVRLPNQILELHDTYKQLTITDKSTNLILFGNSAGGNLVLNYLQYLKKPINVDVPSPSKVILISPWIILEPQEWQYSPNKSYFTNEKYDIIKFNDFKRNLAELFDDNSDDVSPALKTPFADGVWQDVPFLHDPKYKLFVVLGEDESFRDEIMEWAETALRIPLNSQETYGDSNGRFIPKKHEYIRKEEPGKCDVSFYMEPWGIHDSACLLEQDVLPLIVSGKISHKSQLDTNVHFAISRIVDFIDT